MNPRTPATVLLGLLGFSAFSAQAQPDPAKDAEYAAKRDEKRKSPFLQRAPWIFDYRQALEESRKTGKPVFGYFTRSYAPCPACAKVETEHLDKDAFAAFVKDYVPFCHITTWVTTDPDPNLLEEKGGGGFPCVILMDAEGNLLAHDRWDRQEGWYGRMAERGKALQELRRKAAAGDADARFEAYALSLEDGLYPAKGEAERHRAELGELADERRLRLETAPLRREMRKFFQWSEPAQSIAWAEQILAKIPEDREALDKASLCAEVSSNWEGVVRFGEALVRVAPDDARVRRSLVQAYVGKLLMPALAWPHVQAVRRLAPDDAAHRTVEENLKGIGVDRAETGEPVALGDLTATPHVLPAAPSDPDAFFPERLYAVRKDGRLLFGVAAYHYTPKGGPRAHEMGVCSFQGYHTMRRFPQPPDAAAVRAALEKIVSAWPLVARALEQNRKDLPYLVQLPLQQALRADPEAVTALDLMAGLKASGWDAYDVSPPGKDGDWTVTDVRATGTSPDRSKLLRERIFVYAKADGAVDHVYNVQRIPGDPPAYAVVHQTPQSGTYKVSGSPTPWPAEEIPALVRRLEAARPLFAEASQAVTAAAGEKGSDALWKVFELCRAALKTAPEYVPAAEQAALSCLLVSDREVGTDREREAYRRGLGAIEHLLRMDPGNKMGRMAAAVFAFRFGAYPTAVAHARAAQDFPLSRARCLEVLGNLEGTAQDAWRSYDAFDADGVKVEAFVREPAAGAPAPPEGLKLTERCWVGAKDGAYRFSFSYRVQKVKDFTDRELVFDRAGRWTVVATYGGDPSPEDLKAAVLGFLQDLKTK